MSDFTDFESLELHFDWLLRRHSLRCLLLTSSWFLIPMTGYLTYYQIKFPTSGYSNLILCCVGLLCLFISTLCLFPKFAKYLKRFTTIFCILYWISFSLLLLLLVYLEGKHADLDRKSIVTSVYIMLYGVLIGYTLVPWRLEYACIGTVVTNTLLIIMLIVRRNEELDLAVENIYHRIGFLLAVCVAMHTLGVVYKLLFARTVARAFTDTKHCVESRIRLEHERQQQEQLLLSVMPNHLADEMRSKMMAKLRTKPGLFRRKSAYGKFHEMYVKIHESVSILYADIVNFTPLASGIPPSDLVKLLNELFGRFDKLAAENRCTRIKILGDCYYCVSGIPTPQPRHARNCVTMGLGMIKVIHTVREVTESNVDMRIGIHSGVVMSGVIGLKKWQYDVWSDDVTIANCLESSGVPGKIHVSEATLKELNGEYMYEENDFENLHLHVQRKNIKTFLIDPEQEKNEEAKAKKEKSAHVLLPGIMAVDAFKSISMFLAKCAVVSKPFATSTDKSTAERLVCNSLEYMHKCMTVLEKPLHSFKASKGSGGINMLAVHCGNGKREIDCWRQMDYYFFQSITCCSILSIILMCMFMTSSFAMWQHSLAYNITVGFVLLTMIIFSLCAIILKTGNSHIRKKIKCFFKLRLRLDKRLAVFFIVMCCCYLPSIAILFSKHCDNSTNIEHNSKDSEEPFTWCRIYSDFYSLLAIFTLVTFPAISYIIKSITLVIMVTCHLVVFYVINRDDVMFEWITPLSLIMFALTIVLVMHQTELVCKLGFAWRRRFRVEREDVELTRAMNKILLENILPFHVADHFLNKPKGRTDNLYHESYDMICVMFASIPNFWEFYEQSAITKHGIECIRILNEVICDFDQLLQKPKYSSVEKIKTIGSTFMAASGLQKGRQTKKRIISASRLRKDQCVVVMMEFARAMFEVLQLLNKNSFTHFKLRIGINHGPAIAGVIGAQKPQYDIWGDTVNVASRMESNGVMNYIHCREETAAILHTANYESECRGPINIKGKAQPITTYLLR